MVLGNTLSILRPPGKATVPVQTGWNEDLVKNMHEVLGRMQQQISATSGVSAAALTSFATKAILEATIIPIVVTSVQLTGYTADGDGGDGLYKRVGSEPSHALKIMSADGAWWELVPSVAVNPLQAGAVGDGSTDDRTAMQDIWDFAAANGVPCDLLGLEYNCSESVWTSSNLHVRGQFATLFITAWPASGGFVDNVRPDAADRVQSNIIFEQVIFDGSKLATPTGSENGNLFGFARGVTNARVVGCIGRFIRDDDGTASGTGGAAFGIEQGGENIEFIDCIAEDCYRGFRVAGLPGDHGSPTNEPKRAINIRVTQFTARRCGTAFFAHSVGELTADDDSDLGIFDVLVDGMYCEDCGHWPHRFFDVSENPDIDEQKTGVINLGGAQNVKIKDVRVKMNTDFPGSFTDWLGRSGYPASGDFIGAGLSGGVGALIWGWGRNVYIDGVTLDGTVDAYWKCARAITFGDLSTNSPTFSTGRVQQFVVRDVRHVDGTAAGDVFDGQVGNDSGLDNTKMSCRMERITRFIAMSHGIVGTVGTAGLSNVWIEMLDNNGTRAAANVEDWLANGNAAPGGSVHNWTFEETAFGGGYSGVGARSGTTYFADLNLWRSSNDDDSDTFVWAFYNTTDPFPLVGSIKTSGNATAYNIASDARLKGDLRDFDALEMVNVMQAWDFEWKGSGKRAYGMLAQDVYGVMPTAVSPGDEDTPWQMDYSKLVPVLLRAIQQLDAKIKLTEGNT